jgi:FAD binding domain
MQNTNSPTHKKSRFVSLFLVIALAVVAAKDFFDYAAAPTTEKASDFVYSPNPDQIKATTLVLQVAPDPQIPLEQLGGFLNDASHLNKTLVKIASVDDITNALRFARDHKLKVTAAGPRHSVGGQSFVKYGVVLDMRGYKQLRLIDASA